MFDLKDNKIKDKAEKLTSALYLVTSLIPDQEPIKWQLRERSLKFLSDINRLSKQAETPSKTVVMPDTLTDNLTEIISLLDIGISSNLFSVMNFTILRREYQAVKQSIEERAKNELSTLPPVIELRAKPSGVSGPHVSHSLPKTNAPQVAPKDNARQDSILSFIRLKGASSIKDIAISVPGFSSKTIQRELVNLVNKGVLKREGDRRWSRYALA